MEQNIYRVKYIWNKIQKHTYSETYMEWDIEIETLIVRCINKANSFRPDFDSFVDLFIYYYLLY